MNSNTSETTKLSQEYSAYLNSLKGKSWADICYEEEEREEAEAKALADAALKAADALRKKQFDNGNYEIEDGEIFE